MPALRALPRFGLFPASPHSRLGLWLGGFLVYGRQVSAQGNDRRLDVSGDGTNLDPRQLRSATPYGLLLSASLRACSRPALADSRPGSSDTVRPKPAIASSYRPSKASTAARFGLTGALPGLILTRSSYSSSACAYRFSAKVIEREMVQRHVVARVDLQRLPEMLGRRLELAQLPAACPHEALERAFRPQVRLPVSGR